MKFVATLLAALWLAACASVPPAAAPGPARAVLGNFQLEARFALRSTPYGEAPQSASGRLSWRHENAGDRVLVANPLGGGLADIEISRPSRLTLADGRVREAEDADTLLRETTGYALPVARLAGWLVGRPLADGRLTRDAAGRPQRLLEAGWLVDYAYDDDVPEAMPARLTIIRDGELELRLRIESWSELP